MYQGQFPEGTAPDLASRIMRGRTWWSWAMCSPFGSVANVGVVAP